MIAKDLPYFALSIKSSDNLYADSLLKTLGVVYYGQGNFKSGTLAMRTILIKQAGINFDQTR
ncbi:MAG: D-alanyl-D-alanine carboxypeptidase, partial [Marinirhabdus sp.]